MLVRQAHANTEAVLGRDGDTGGSDSTRSTGTRFDQDMAYIENKRLFDLCHRIGSWTRFLAVEGKRGGLPLGNYFWLATHVKGRLWFHPPDVPVEVWAVSLQPMGVIWAEAEVVRITERNVVVRYAGEVARLDRQRMWTGWAFWRGVRFVSSRTGRIADMLDRSWRQRYGARPAASRRDANAAGRGDRSARRVRRLHAGGGSRGLPRLRGSPSRPWRHCESSFASWSKRAIVCLLRSGQARPSQKCRLLCPQERRSSIEE